MHASWLNEQPAQVFRWRSAQHSSHVGLELGLEFRQIQERIISIHGSLWPTAQLVYTIPAAPLIKQESLIRRELCFSSTARDSSTETSGGRQWQTHRKQPNANWNDAKPNTTQTHKTNCATEKCCSHRNIAKAKKTYKPRRLMRRKNGTSTQNTKTAKTEKCCKFTKQNRIAPGHWGAQDLRIQSCGHSTSFKDMSGMFGWKFRF